MAEFTVNAQRFDPYKNFKFLVVWDGRTVAGVSKVSAIKRTTEVVKHRSGGDPSTPRKSAGRTEFDGITLERGITHDLEFDQWANKVIVIELLNEAGQVAVAFKVYRAWVSEYQITSELDGNANAVAIQHIKLECEGIERDPEVPEPEEPSFTFPS